jgi:hypothetical protein
MAYLRFHNFHFPHCHLVVQVAFWAEMAFSVELPPVLVELQQFLCAYHMSADILLYHFGMEGSQPYNFYKPLPGVFLSQPPPSDAPEIQLFASSLLGLRHEVS